MISCYLAPGLMYYNPSWMSNKFQCVYLSQVAGIADRFQSSYFARDDRVYKVFVEKIDRRKSEIESKCSRRLRWELHILKDFLDGRTLTFRVSVLPSFCIPSSQTRQHREKSNYLWSTWITVTAELQNETVRVRPTHTLLALRCHIGKRSIRSCGVLSSKN